MPGKLPHTWVITAGSLVSALIQIQKNRSSHIKFFCAFGCLIIFLCFGFFFNRRPNTQKSAQIQDLYAGQAINSYIRKITQWKKHNSYIGMG